jgi:outer membrane lipoprotein-sorting protein
MMTRPRLGILPFLALSTVVALATSAAAQDPDVTTIVTRMKQAVEPPRASAAKILLTVSADRETSSVVLGMARAKHSDANRLLFVVLGPADLRGTAYLVEDGSPDQAPQWMYVPAIGRIRKLVTPEAFTAFLNSDFTFADLGFVDLRAAYTLVGTEDVSGKKAYRVQAVPKQQWYYTKIVTLVDAGTFMPIERSYYDVAGQLWKTQRWEHPAVINGALTSLNTKIEDVQAKTHSDLAITDLRYDATVPDALVTPEGLINAAGAPVWKSLAATPVKAPAKAHK